MSIENIIFSNLIYNEEYTRKVLPFLKTEYFSEYKSKVIFDLINDYVNKYNRCPTLDSLGIDLSNKQNVNEQVFKECKDTLSVLDKDDNSIEWLTNVSEDWCKERALHNALLKSISIVDDKSGKLDKGIIPQILTDAIGVSFDNHIGHNFVEDADARFEYYHKKESRISFDVDLLNNITEGGLPPKTLNMILAGVHVGKTLTMCHMASYNLLCNRNVLYITMEMAEEEIAKRIDANLLDIPMDELKSIPKDIFDKKIERVKRKGVIVVKEYPTASGNVNNFRYLLNELKIKRNFIPDIIYIDYINICASSRLKLSSSVNSYTLIKAVSEEIRGLAVETGVPIVSATQTNRSGYDSSDIDMTDVSESFGLPMTVDFLIGLTTSDELEQVNQIAIKQLKNRYMDKSKDKRFVVGVDRSKMRLYNVEREAQTLMNDDKPIFDSGKFMTEDMERSLGTKKFGKGMFSDFT